MSVTNVSKFIDKIGDDAELLQELKAKGNPYSKFDKYSYAENILAPLADKMGVPFFVEEWVTWRENMLESVSAETKQVPMDK
ncbi:MAG: Nif11-like leader peptide family natural product precursor [Selenomonadaceae bacterium]|nr:Nif11-like leader peptide family natural product precursor [Selenomonadaceae bacterium]